MHTKTKVRLEAIEQAQLALEALPEYRADEVTKMQAVRMLITHIRATQSKGYSLEAIGKLLSERGIPITTAALRAYVSDANGRTSRKKKRKAKDSAQTPKEARVDEKTDIRQKSAPAQSVTIADRRSAVPAAPSVVEARERPAAATSPVVGRRSAFTVRRDTEDI